MNWHQTRSFSLSGHIHECLRTDALGKVEPPGTAQVVGVQEGQARGRPLSPGAWPSAPREGRTTSTPVLSSPGRPFPSLGISQGGGLRLPGLCCSLPGLDPRSWDPVSHRSLLPPWRARRPEFSLDCLLMEKLDFRLPGSEWTEATALRIPAPGVAVSASPGPATPPRKGQGARAQAATHAREGTPEGTSRTAVLWQEPTTGSVPGGQAVQGARPRAAAFTRREVKLTARLERVMRSQTGN